MDQWLPDIKGGHGLDYKGEAQRSCSGDGITGQGLGPDQACLGPSGSVWVLDFMQERFHNKSPGEFESTFVNAENSETKEGLRIEEARGQSLGGAALAHWKVREKGSLETGSEV